MTVRKTEIDEKNLATVEFSFTPEEVEKEKSAAFRKQSGKFRIPGFRPGKAPRTIIEKMYGPDVFLDDAVNALINANYTEITSAPGKEIVSRPSFDLVSEESELVIKAEMYVKPEIKLGDYKGIPVSAYKAPVTDEEITSEIDAARKRNAREIDVEDRAAQSGDTAVIDYEGSVDGVPFEGGKDTGYHLKLGSGSFIPGFEDQVIGHSAGDDFDVNVTFPEDYHAKELAGKAAVFKVKLHKITYEELPEADDDFAVDVSEFNTFAEYRDDVAKKIADRHAATADREVRDKLDTALAGLVKAEIPAPMIDSEVEAMIRDAESRISMNGIDFKTYLGYFGMTLDQYKENSRPEAEKAVKVRLALEKIAADTGIEITDEEIDKEYQSIATGYSVEVDYAKEQLPKEEIVSNLKLRRAAEAVKEAAVIEFTDKLPEPAKEEEPAGEDKKEEETAEENK